MSKEDGNSRHEEGTTGNFVTRCLSIMTPSLNTTKNRKDGATAAVVSTALKDDILHNITSFIDPVDELPLALTCKAFYFALSHRAMIRFKVHTEVLVTERPEIYRMRVLGKGMDMLRDCLHEFFNNDDNDNNTDNNNNNNNESLPSYVNPTLGLLKAIIAAHEQGDSLLSSGDWNDEKHQWIPFRFLLHCSYSVPVQRASLGPAFGASTPAAGPHGLAWIMARGALMILDLSTLDVTLMELTREANPTRVPELAPPRYCFIFDKLWYCQDSGKFVLKHGAAHEHEVHSVRLLDPTRTNEDIGRGPGVAGIDQQFIHTTAAFQACTRPGVSVSTEHGLVFFVAHKENGSLYMESYETTHGQMVASTTHAAVKRFPPGSDPRYFFCTRIIVSRDKLLVAVYVEEAGPFPDAGFGIYVFDCRSLSFLSYTPMFEETGVSIEKVSADWLVYAPEGRGPLRSSAVKITGGNINNDNNVIEPLGEIDLGQRSAVLLVTSTSIYGYDPDEREGTIQIDEFDIRSGKKVRTLDTGVDWVVPDEDDDDHPYQRMMANAMVVGKRLVFLISSVGSHINTMVTFALPTRD